MSIERVCRRYLAPTTRVLVDDGSVLGVSPDETDYEGFAPTPISAPIILERTGRTGLATLCLQRVEY